MNHQNNDDNKVIGNSKKKVMCYNMLNKKQCDYGIKCVYAHNLSEQKIIPLRHKAYTIIKTVTDLSNINLILDNKLYEMLLQLTKVCILCSKDACPGGYNCRYGAINSKCKICYDDLVYGNCKKPSCQSIHLTTRGLIPYFKQKNKNKMSDESQNSSGDSTDNDKFAKKRLGFNKKYYDNNKLKTQLNDIQGVLLTEKFILNHFGKIYTSDIDSDSNSTEDVDKMIQYFNDDTENNSDDESIFLV